MASFVLGTVTSKLPELVEKYEPKLEQGLRSALKNLKQHPPHDTAFLSNWNKLNTAVQQELGGPPGATAPVLAPVPGPAVGVGRRGKRTRRTRRHRK